MNYVWMLIPLNGICRQSTANWLLSSFEWVVFNFFDWSIEGDGAFRFVVNIFNTSSLIVKLNFFLNDWIKFKSCLRCLSLLIDLLLIAIDIASSKIDACFSVNGGFWNF